MTDAVLLQQILAEKVGTDGLIQMGDTQPFDLIRLYENPANNTILSNLGSDNMTAASTTVLVIDEGASRTGLSYKPDLSLLRHTGSDVKLIVTSTVEQELELVMQHAGHTSTQTVTVQPDKTAVLTIGLLAGIATVVGSHNFFDQAAAGNGAGGGANTLVNASYDGTVLSVHPELLDLSGDGAGDCLMGILYHPIATEITGQFIVPPLVDGQKIAMYLVSGQPPYTSIPQTRFIRISKMPNTGNMLLQTASVIDGAYEFNNAVVANQETINFWMSTAQFGINVSGNPMVMWGPDMPDPHCMVVVYDDYNVVTPQLPITLTDAG